MEKSKWRNQNGEIKMEKSNGEIKLEEAGRKGRRNEEK